MCYTNFMRPYYYFYSINRFDNKIFAYFVRFFYADFSN